MPPIDPYTRAYDAVCAAFARISTFHSLKDRTDAYFHACCDLEEAAAALAQICNGNEG